MKNMNRISDNELAMVNGGAPVIKGYVAADGKEKSEAVKAAANRGKGGFGWHWGDNWGDEGYWH